MTSAASARSIATTIILGGPVQITACRANTLTNASGFTRFSIDFENLAKQPATDVRFEFHALSARGEEIVSGTGELFGTFSPGVAIQNYHSNQAGTIYGLPTYAASITCAVQLVTFADGTQWQAVPQPPRRLYFPPTPSPTWSPH